MPSSSAARQSSGTSPTGSAAASSIIRRVSAGRGSSRLAKPCSMRLVSGEFPDSPNLLAAIGCSPFGSSSSASGFPSASPRIRAFTPSSSGPGIVASSSSRESSAASPSTTSSGNPSSTSPSPDSRSANTRPTRSARSRRATNAIVWADTRSSHCASSTMQISGRPSATSASRLSTARPTRKRSGGGPALRPNAVLSASRCGLGRCPSPSSIGAHSACRPANANSISDSTPASRTIRHPSADADRCPRRAVLPTPASPRRTSTRLWPVRTPATSCSSA